MKNSVWVMMAGGGGDVTGRKKNERVIEAGVRYMCVYIEGKCRKRGAYRKTEKGQGIYIKGAICKGRCAVGGMLITPAVRGGGGLSATQRKRGLFILVLIEKHLLYVLSL